MTIYDIVIHDTYILPLTANCAEWNHDPNDSQICKQIFARLGITDTSDQLQVGSAYWAMLTAIVLTAGIILGIFRFVTGFLAGSRSGMLILISIVWFLSATIPLTTGFIDTFYYVLRGMEIPETLPWLSNVGLFQYIQFFGDPDIVEWYELIFLNIVGFIILVVFLGWLHIHHKRGHFDRILD